MLIDLHVQHKLNSWFKGEVTKLLIYLAFIYLYKLIDSINTDVKQRNLEEGINAGIVSTRGWVLGQIKRLRMVLQYTAITSLSPNQSRNHAKRS